LRAGFGVCEGSTGTWMGKSVLLGQVRGVGNKFLLCPVPRSKFLGVFFERNEDVGENELP
jgi:hypothetical protein